MSNLSKVWFKVTDLEVTHGKGCRVTTVDGQEYLDFAAGIAVNSTGHCHPKVTAAIAAQAEKFIHAQANVYTHDLLETLAGKPWQGNLKLLAGIGLADTGKGAFENAGAKA